MKNFFYLQRSDRRAIYAMLAVLVVAVGTTLYVGHVNDETQTALADSTATHAGDNARQAKRQGFAGYYDTGERKAELFAFDPNTADSTQLLRLGLAPWQVRNIYRYRAKGGIFRRPADFARIYGLTAGQYRRLSPYIRISDDYRPAAEVYATEKPGTYFHDTLKYSLKIKQGEHIALNLADTSALKRVPGIGSGFARAIVNYRERLGGYYDVRQLLEIDNFPAASLAYFTVDAACCKKLNINKMTLAQLRRHPYIGFYQARTIVDHRRLHGPIRSLDELRLYKDFPTSTIDKLRNYVTF